MDETTHQERKEAAKNFRYADTEDAKHLMSCFSKELCACDNERTASSVKTYCYNLRWLAERLDGFTETEAPPFETIMDYMLESRSTARRRQASFVAMKVLLNARGKKVESAKYARPLINVKNELQAVYEKQERNEKQSRNWVEYRDLKLCAK